MIQRQLLQRLKQSLSRAPAVALLGARQVGKTTLARSLVESLDATYLDLESQEDLLKLSDAGAYLRAQSGKLVVLDEIQRAPEIFAVLRGVIDEGRRQSLTQQANGQFLLLGSASMQLLQQSSQSLAGRIGYLEMTGLNVLEVGGGQTPQQGLWLRGGFPGSYLAGSDDAAMDWLENLIRSYLERDVPLLGFRVPAARLRRLWTMLAHLQGEPVNVSTLAANLEVQRAAVNQYLDILVQLLLVRRLPPWHANVKKRLVKAPRYYVRDSGLQHRLLAIETHDDLLSNPVLGKSWEGFVIENIHSVLPQRTTSYFYRTAAGAEVDLVLKLSSTQVWAVEIKHGHTPTLSKHFDRACSDIGATHKYVVYGGDDEFTVGQNTTVISLSKLMAKLQLESYSAKSAGGA